jgi:dTDP-4-dehydrorhamnose 3,5-epimerase
MKLEATMIPGCYEIEFSPRLDMRGSFVKTFQTTAFHELGLETNFRESYFSVSQPDVLRGMHFQLPPGDGAKLICCLSGAIFDVALDLRVGSPTFKRHVEFELRGDRPRGAYLPRGVAHGFYTREGPATMIYQVSTEYKPDLDSGVLWNSLDIDWPSPSPICSERDRRFVSLKDFESPFLFITTEVHA